MKFNILFLFFVCLTSGVLQASSLDGDVVDARETLTLVADDTGDVLPMASYSDISVSIVDDEVCYSVTISVEIAGILQTGVTVSGCGETAAAAWSAFTSAFRRAREQ